MEVSEIAKRVEKIEDEHNELTQLFKDFSKDFHILTNGFNEVKDILKVLSQTEIQFQLFRQEFKAHDTAEVLTAKRLHERLDKVESNQSRVAWTVLTAVIIAVLGIMIKGGIHG